MEAILTVYVHPDNKEQLSREIRNVCGETPGFFPAEHKFLSWIGEAALNVSSLQEALKLEREIISLEGVIDAEIIPEELVEEEINQKFAEYNEIIGCSKFALPAFDWFHHTIQIQDAIGYAHSEFIAGRGFFDSSSSKAMIALIDTGYSRHPEVSLFNSKAGKNFMPRENVNDPLDTLESTRPVPIRWGGHGTSCAGLIIGSDSVIEPENRIPRENCFFDDQVNGLLPNNIDLIPYRVSKNIISFSSRMANAISHLVAQKADCVISMSHASLLNRKIYRAATRESYEKGMILVAAPGSHIFPSRKVFTYPAKYPETIAPAASTVNNQPWRLTHGGPEVDLCAPGFEMYIPWPFKTNDNRLGYVYKWSEGSSFAVPIVATAAALWKMHHGKKLDNLNPIEQIELFRSIIKKTATPFSGNSSADLYGSGIINFKKMLEFPIPEAKKLSPKIDTIEPEFLFRTDKEHSSFLRELTYLKLLNSFHQSQPAENYDFYFDRATPALKQWMELQVKSKQQYLEMIITGTGVLI